LKIAAEAAVRMSKGKLFHTVGPATQNARLPRCRLVHLAISTVIICCI